MPLALPLVLLLQSGLLSASPVASVNGPVQELNSPDNGQRITVSVLEEDEVRSSFSILAERQDIPYAAWDGNYARAHKMVRILEDKGITAAKAWVVGALYVDSKLFGEMGLSYHVAPLVFVRVGRAITPYVLDPSLFDKPVPYEAWKAKLLAKPKAKLERAYFTTRFAYDPDDRTAALSSYSEESLQDMNQTNRNLLRALFMYERGLQIRGPKQP